MTITFITTVFNEEKTISLLLDSLIIQTLMADEIIIVDAFSSDKTFSILLDYKKIFSKQFPEINFLILQKKGNRSVGRNEAIKKAKGEIITATDAGCILKKDWIKNITNKFENRSIDVVAGYYKAKVLNDFQRSLGPYVLVMPDRINAEKFLPATRSIAFRKSIWKKIGGFDERYSHNEDYVFARKLKKSGANIVFSKNAIAYWIPRNTFKDAFVMFFRFALGDIESGILRPKVAFIFLRYLVVVSLFFLSFVYNLDFLYIIFLLLIIYIVYTIFKNFKYVKHFRALFYLPIMQFCSDIAVMCGSAFGFYYYLKGGGKYI